MNFGFNVLGYTITSTGILVMVISHLVRKVIY